MKPAYKRTLFPLVCAALLLGAAPAFAKGKCKIRTVPYRADGALTKAEAQIAEKKYIQAIDTIGLVLQRRPADADALTYAGYAWLKLGDAGKAETYLNHALEADPHHLGANKYLADVYLEKDQYGRAVEQMQALRLACGSFDCAELNDLQAELNAARAGKKAAKEDDDASGDEKAEKKEDAKDE